MYHDPWGILLLTPHLDVGIQAWNLELETTHLNSSVWTVPELKTENVGRFCRELKPAKLSSLKKRVQPFELDGIVGIEASKRQYRIWGPFQYPLGFDIRTISIL